MKRQHPIRKMLAALDLHNAATTTSPNEYQRAVARHVKPLLDALWADHEVCREGVALGDPDDCKTCKMVAEWRKPLD